MYQRRGAHTAPVCACVARARVCVCDQAQLARKAAERAAEAAQDQQILQYLEDKERREQARATMFIH